MLSARCERLYKTERAKGIQARYAFHHAKTEDTWLDRECGEFDEPELGNVRLQIIPDEMADYAHLAGDSFNPDVNSDISPSLLERQEKEFKERINRDGVWGVVGEYFNGEKWIHADSVWGFVGQDWENSGYDSGIKSETLRQADSMTFCPTCKRAN